MGEVTETIFWYSNKEIVIYKGDEIILSLI